ncbi:MAG: DinB family protein [Acidobacteriota bacterium]
MRAAFLLVTVAGAALAQNPLSADTKTAWNGLKDYLVRAAAKMPEEHYGFKPAPEVKTYGQMLGHIADAQYMLCSLAAGEKRAPAEVEKTKTSKADVTAALQDSIRYCDGVYDALTDARAAETVKLFGRERSRLGALMTNLTHSWEHYGNLVTYLRIKGIVPPSSEPKPGR